MYTQDLLDTIGIISVEDKTVEIWYQETYKCSKAVKICVSDKDTYTPNPLFNIVSPSANI